MSLLAASSLPDDQSKWILVGLAVLTVLYVVVRPRMAKKDPLAKPPGQASLAAQRTAERQMQELLVELSEMARQISAQLDTRSTKLEMLIQDADERIARLESMSRGDDGRADRPVIETTATVVRSGELIDVPPWKNLESSGANALPDLRPEPAHLEAEAMPAGNPRHEEIYRLADQGCGPHEIADELRRPRGEIELILALRSR